MTTGIPPRARLEEAQRNVTRWKKKLAKRKADDAKKAKKAKKARVQKKTR